MKCYVSFVLCHGLLLPVATLAADPPTSERLDLLERRVSRITDLTLQLDEVRRENRELRGQVENLGYEIEQLERKQRDHLSGYRPASRRRPGCRHCHRRAAPAARPGPARPGRGGDRLTAPQLPASATDRKQIQAEYQAAYDLLSPQQQRYDDAAKAFAGFSEEVPAR